MGYLLLHTALLCYVLVVYLKWLNFVINGKRTGEIIG